MAIGLGTFVQVLDTSIANVAVPYIAGNLGVSADQGTWVITAFSASNAIVLPLTGWLSDYFGRVRLFVWSVLLFGIASFLCGLATSLMMLVILRICQGAVAGSLIPLSQSLMQSSNAPKNQGIALGVWGMIVMVAPILGPIIGGYLTYVYSWPWIFYVNVPICLFSALVVWGLLKDHESQIVRNPIDWVGLGLLSLGVACLQIMLDKGKDLDWFKSNVIIILTVIAVIALCYFLIWNSFQKYKIVDFSFFRNRNFAVGTLVVTVGYLLFFTSAVTLPLWLQTEQGYTAYWAGIAVAPVGIIPFFFSALLGKYLHKADARFFIALSFFLFAMSFFYQTNFTTAVSLSSIMFARFLQGFGVVFFLLPLVKLSLADIPEHRYASASGLFNFIRILVGSGFGTSLAVQIWTRLEIFHHARLAEASTAFRHVTTQFYEGLSQASSSIPFTPDVINRVLDQQIEQQAFMLSTNDIAWLAAWMFLGMIPVIFFAKETVKTSATTIHVHEHM